ncbi:hypothetical protein GCM10009737_22770 [Nocardioides lentus]|uniref:SprT-like domain-containing protein n=2 Tax=Nocardioides lentus TaxID=338077 RepID=A0ABP5AT11_9ACTN
MATALMAEHGLHGWTLRFDRAKRRAGVCRHHERVIGLSGPLTLLHDEAEVRDTVLHEVAHALVGPTEGHGPRWRATARRLGCSAQRALPADAPRVPGAWVGTCPAGHTTDRHRRPERVLSCPRCSSRFSLDHVYTWTHRGLAAPLHPRYLAELDGLAARAAAAGVDPDAAGWAVGVGDRVRVLTPGRWHGTVGEVVKVGRTRYHVRAAGGVLTVPMAAVAPVLHRPA